MTQQQQEQTDTVSFSFSFQGTMKRQRPAEQTMKLGVTTMTTMTTTTMAIFCTVLLLAMTPTMSFVVPAATVTRKQPFQDHQNLPNENKAYCRRRRGPFSPPYSSVLLWEKANKGGDEENTSNDNTDDDDDQLSDIDARVLQSMLRDDKLDLGTEENMKKLLERGVTAKTTPRFETSDAETKLPDDSDSPYASQILKVRPTAHRSPFLSRPGTWTMNQLMDQCIDC